MRSTSCSEASRPPTTKRHGELLKAQIEKAPDQIYVGLLTVLLRLVFLLYAEDRDVMPRSPLYVQNYSVHGLFEKLRADFERYPDTVDQRYGAWARLLALFRAVYGGSKHPQLKMPARKGFLFDPERYPFLEGRSGKLQGLPLLSDGVIFRVLRNLLILDGERLSYRTLDVEQIGSVYERMMGFKIELTEGTYGRGQSGEDPRSTNRDQPRHPARRKAGGTCKVVVGEFRSETQPQSSRGSEASSQRR